MTQISILGCGWLGFPLAEALIEKGFDVKGSTTSADKISLLKNARIQPFLISLNSDGIEGNVTSFLENSEILIIDIPPKLRNSENDNFVEKIKILLPFIEKSSVKKVLFVSSTSVYGESNLIVTEDTMPNPDTESGRQLLQAEQLLQNNTAFKTTILRFGGLIGKDRHPIHFLAGKKLIENPDAPINLIHQTDCIGIILKIIQKESWNQIFNAVCPFHPTRSAYYTQKAVEFNLVLPEFGEGKSSGGKIISSEKLETILGYEFILKKL